MREEGKERGREERRKGGRREREGRERTGKKEGGTENPMKLTNTRNPLITISYTCTCTCTCMFTRHTEGGVSPPIYKESCKVL